MAGYLLWVGTTILCEEQKQQHLKEVFAASLLRQGLEFIAEHDPRLVRVVDCRYFVGLTLEETALVLDMNEKTVRRDWVKARAMLRSHLASGQTTRMPD